MNTATEELLARHQLALKTALAEAKRLADGMIVTLGGCDNRNEFVDLDLVATEATIKRLREIQRQVIEHDQAVRRLSQQALSEI